MQLIDGENLIIFYFKFFLLLNYYFSNYLIEASSPLTKIKSSNKNTTTTNNINQQMNFVTKKLTNNLKIKNNKIITKQSTTINSPRLIRQIGGNEETDGIKKSSFEKPKRYKCFLVDDDDDEEEEGQKQQKLNKNEKLKFGQNSYFAGFLKDGEENNKLLGWEEVGQSSDNPRRSEGINTHYSLKSGQQNKEETTTKIPIIEYIDDYEASPQKEDNLDINSADSTGSFNNQWETIPAIQTKFLTKNSLNVQKTKKENNNFNSIESSASLEDKKERKEQIEEEINENEKIEEEGEEESDEDLYSDEEGNNAIISTTTIKSIKINKYENKIKKDSQRNLAVGGSPHAKVFPGLAKIITPTLITTTNKPKIEQLITKSVVKVMESRENGINKNELLLNQNNIKYPQNNEKQQQKYEEKLTQVKIPPKDSQGRSLILSPEHCKMIESYAHLYGATPSSVLSFVRNNCAFVKMYLPTASCAEIETLVKSCYERRIMREKQMQKRRILLL